MQILAYRHSSAKAENALGGAAVAEDDVNQNILRFRMADGSDWRLTGWPKVMKWLNAMQSFWDWLPGTPFADPANIKGHIPSRVMQLISDAEALRSSGRQPSDLAPSISQYLTDGYAPIHPRSERGRILARVKADAGGEAAAFAFAVLGRLVSVGSANTPEQARGAFLAINPELLEVSNASGQFMAERKRFRAALQRIEESAAEEQAERERDWNTTLHEAGEAGRRWSQQRARRWLRYAKRARVTEGKAISSIRDVEAAYKEHMGLAAPVKYWKDKATEHENAEYWARLWVIFFFPVALAGMAYAFNETGVSLITSVKESQVPNAPPFPNAIFIVASAGLASCAGLVFWVGRLLTKLYLSQHHLKQDAEERATMTETYLALIENGAASEADRQVILSALFRNTPDGIVKEDGGLDPSIAAALGKFLAKP